MSTTNSNADYAALLLRVSMGILFLAHAGLEIFVFTPAGTAAFFESLGFPGALAYLVILAELVGGVALIAGVWIRWISLALIPILLGSIYAPHGLPGSSSIARAAAGNSPHSGRSLSSRYLSSATGPMRCASPGHDRSKRAGVYEAKPFNHRS